MGFITGQYKNPDGGRRRPLYYSSRREFLSGKTCFFCLCLWQLDPAKFSKN